MLHQPVAPKPPRPVYKHWDAQDQQYAGTLFFSFLFHMRLDLSSFFAAGALSLAVSAHPLAPRQQPEAVNTPKLDLEPLSWGDVNFIQTTDTHGKKEKDTLWVCIHCLHIYPSFRLACCKYLHISLSQMNACVLYGALIGLDCCSWLKSSSLGS